MRQLLIRCSRAIFGWPPKPGTVIQKQTLIARIAGAHNLHCFIETGTFQGEMIAAQRENFHKLISVELSQELFEAARLRFSSDSRIELYQGDSGVKLSDAVIGLNEPGLFWLDAHYSRGATAGAHEMAPILKELSCLTARSQFQDAILIDDARLFGLKSDYPKLGVIKQFAAKHWPEHSFSIEDDVICILPPRQTGVSC